MGLTVPLLTVAIRQENDILLARQRARQISQFLGFSSGDIARITTALSEVARNAFEYARRRHRPRLRSKDKRSIGRICSSASSIKVRASRMLRAVLSPNFESRTGMGHRHQGLARADGSVRRSRRSLDVGRRW